MRDCRCRGLVSIPVEWVKSKSGIHTVVIRYMGEIYGEKNGNIFVENMYVSTSTVTNQVSLLDPPRSHDKTPSAANMSSVQPGSENCQICHGSARLSTMSTKPEFNKNKIYQQLAAEIENSFANLVEFPSTNGSIIPAQQLHMSC